MQKKSSSVKVKFFLPQTNDLKFGRVKSAVVSIFEKDLILQKIFKIQNEEKIEFDFENLSPDFNKFCILDFFNENGEKLTKFCKKQILNSDFIDFSKKASPLAEVLFGIKNIYDFSSLENDGRLLAIKKVCDFEIENGLYNFQKLISELKGFSFPYNCTKDDYIFKTGSVTFFAENLKDFSVFVDDSYSECVKIGENEPYKIQNVIPGQHTIFVFSPDGKKINSINVKIENQQELKIENLFQKEEILNERLDFLPSYEEFEKCFCVDSKKNEFVVLLSQNLLKKNAKSVEACFNSGINDHDGEYFGVHKKMIFDERGFWFCKIRFDEVFCTNQCGQPSYNFKIDGKMSEPPFFVPDGYIYQKFNETQGEKRFLVLIYPFQNEKEISLLLKNAKSAKTLKDFNLQTEEGKKSISNFRQLPGTKKIFRSFHPIKDDKKNISDTSLARMESLWALCEKYKIQNDINLSDVTLQNPTYKMPEFYKKIVENQKILYMTDCNYSVCYENTDSLVFANGIKKIVEFVNKNEGNFLLHCAIGTDRTGVVGAVLSLLCGACWLEVEKDYCASVNMGILEYRGPFCIRYAIKKMLGLDDFSEDLDFQGLIKNHLVKMGVLTENQILDFIKKVA